MFAHLRLEPGGEEIIDELGRPPRSQLLSLYKSDVYAAGILFAEIAQPGEDVYQGAPRLQSAFQTRWFGWREVLRHKNRPQQRSQVLGGEGVRTRRQCEKLILTKRQ